MTTITRNYEETEEAFPNPFIGFRPTRYLRDLGFGAHEYASTFKHYIAYSDLESCAHDSVDRIREWSARAWAGLPERNLKVLPRVVIQYPGAPDSWGDLPHDGTPAQWHSPALLDRLVAFAAKLGQAWDLDPRVAAVEMGLWGKWGEHHIWPETVQGRDRIPEDFQEALGEAFTQAFRHKKVLIRHPDTFRDFTFGFYWDSFALPEEDEVGRSILGRNHWQTQMQSGEVAYDWGTQAVLGASPGGTLVDDEKTDRILTHIRQQHTSSLGWISDYDQADSRLAHNAARIQRALGYRFVVTSASYPTEVGPGEFLNLSLEVENRGSAPLYYPWPLEVSLLDADRPIHRQAIPSCDPTQWMPGERHKIPALLWIPAGFPEGVYTLAVALLDPAGGRPGLRFANRDYYQGGRMPLGRVGVGRPAPSQDTGPFDGLKTDRTLGYQGEENTYE